MATDNMAGLFSTPEQYQQQRMAQQEAQAIEQAKLSNYERALAGQQMGFNRLADVGAGALGVQDPQMRLASMRQQVLQGLDQTDPQAIMQAAQRLAQSGDNQGASQLANAAREAAAKSAETTLKQAQAVKNLREGNAAMLTTEQRNFIQARDDGYKGSFNQWLTEQKKAGSTNVNVSTGENAYGTAFGKGIADQDLAKYTLAQKAPEILATADNTEKLLQSDKVFTGTGASAKLNLLALGQGLGVTGKNADEVIANTQQLQQQRSQAVLNQIKSSGLGTGQGFTDKDLKFLQDSAAGSITLSKETLQRQINVERKVARAATKDWNSRLGSMPQKVVGPMGLSNVELPTQTAFDSVEEATAAKLPKNTIITIGGRKAVVE